MKRTELIAIALVLATFVGLCWSSQKCSSVTVDEFAHLPAGYYYWKTGNYSLYAKNPPLVKMVAAIPLLFMTPAFERDLGRFPNAAWRPWLFANDFMFKNLPAFIKLFEAGRAVIIFLGVLLGIALYLSARARYGKAGAFLSLLVFVLCPDVLAHSSLATVDAGSALFIFLAVMSLIRYLNKPTWPNTVLAGLGLGLAQVSKFSALSLLIFYFSAPFLLVWPFKTDRLAFKSLLLHYCQTLAMILIWIALVAVCYRGQGLFRPTSEYRFQSKPIQLAQSVFRGLPSPFPQTYLTGLDDQQRDVEEGEGEFTNYLMGKWYHGVSKQYLAIALLVKVPIAIQLLLAISLLLSVCPGAAKFRITPDEALIIVIMLSTFGLFAFRNSLQIGIRYMLPVFPLAFLLIGRLGKAASRRGPLTKIVLGALLIWLAVANWRIYPHYLSYFNEYIGGPANGYKVLLDSNLDWGQDLPSLARFMKDKQIEKIDLDYFGHPLPSLYGVNYQALGTGPLTPYTAISVQLLQGAGTFDYPMLFNDPPVLVMPDLVRPYLTKMPVAYGGYSIWIFKNE